MIEATLITASISIAFFHTIIGVDHYLPFVLLGKARRWSLSKTLRLTAICGLGHLLGSIAIGTLGIVLGVALNKLEWLEGIRGDMAAWSMIAFGLVYAFWHLFKNHSSSHHTHHFLAKKRMLSPTSSTEEHTQTHSLSHQNDAVSSWTLFIIFVFGPCEALIPLLMMPASKQNWGLVCTVTFLFSIVTVLTMLGAVVAGHLGMKFAPLHALERHTNTFAGFAIAFSGIAIQCLGI